MTQTAQNIPPEPIAEAKISFGEKLAFFWVHIGNVPVMTTVNSFLLIFYTDVVGLNPAAVGTLFLISRVMDGFTDPLMGFLIDHLPHTRWGRFRPYLMGGAVLCTINFVILWLAPLYASSGNLVIAYVSYLFIGITFDMIDIPLGAILPTMTADPQERNVISAYKGMAYLLGYAAITAGTLPLVNLFPTPQTGWTITILIYAVIILIFTILPTLKVKERIMPEKDERYSLRQMGSILFNNRPLVIILIATIMVNIGAGLSGGAAIFYYTYNLGDAYYFSLSGLITLPGVLLGFALFSRFSPHFSKKFMMFALLMLAALGVGSRLLIPYSAVGWVMASVFISAIGSGGAIPLIFSIIADIVDYTEQQHGYRAEGAVVSIQTFTQKTGLGLGGAIPGYILASTGYIPNGIQPQSALNGILLATVALPFAAYLISSVIFLTYPSLSPTDN